MPRSIQTAAKTAALRACVALHAYPSRLRAPFALHAYPRFSPPSLFLIPLCSNRNSPTPLPQSSWIAFLIVFVQTDTQKIDNAFRSFQKRSCLLTAFYGKIFFKLLKAMPIFLGLPQSLWFRRSAVSSLFVKPAPSGVLPLTLKDTYSDSI